MNKEKTGNEFTSLIMTAVFMVGFLLLVIFGTGIYRNITNTREEANLSRTLSSYLHTASKMNEAGIEIDTIEGQKVLVIADGDTGFGNRIYLNEGYLVEDYGMLGDELHRSSALKIAETSIFELEEISDTLIRATTDDGDVFLTRMKGGQ